MSEDINVNESEPVKKKFILKSRSDTTKVSNLQSDLYAEKREVERLNLKVQELENDKNKLELKLQRSLVNADSLLVPKIQKLESDIIKTEKHYEDLVKIHVQRDASMVFLKTYVGDEVDKRKQKVIRTRESMYHRLNDVINKKLEKITVSELFEALMNEKHISFIETELAFAHASEAKYKHEKDVAIQKAAFLERKVDHLESLLKERDKSVAKPTQLEQTTLLSGDLFQELEEKVKANFESFLNLNKKVNSMVKPSEEVDFQLRYKIAKVMIKEEQKERKKVDEKLKQLIDAQNNNVQSLNRNLREEWRNIAKAAINYESQILKLKEDIEYFNKKCSTNDDIIAKLLDVNDIVHTELAAYKRKSAEDAVKMTDLDSEKQGLLEEIQALKEKLKEMNLKNSNLTQKLNIAQNHSIASNKYNQSMVQHWEFKFKNKFMLNVKELADISHIKKKQNYNV